MSDDYVLQYSLCPQKSRAGSPSPQPAVFHRCPSLWPGSSPAQCRIVLSWRVAWQAGDELPEALVTTGAAVFRGGIVIPGGEDRPGSRPAAVWKLEFSTKDYLV